MKFCYNTNLTLPKQSQRSRSILQDGSTSLGLFWKEKDSVLQSKKYGFHEVLCKYMLLIISQSAQMYFTPPVYITCNQNLSILFYCLSIFEYLIKLNHPIALRKAKVTINNPIALRKAKLVYSFGLSECSRVINSDFQKIIIYIMGKLFTA